MPRPVLVLSSLLLMTANYAARAQEVTALYGTLHASQIDRHTYSWEFEYQRTLGSHTAISGAWLNEGHPGRHRRDGPVLQFWGRTHVDSRLTLSAGVGGYYYFDTMATGVKNHYLNDHGLGSLLSLDAAWQMGDHWLAHLRGNWVDAAGDFNTRSFAIGFGYLLSPTILKEPAALFRPRGRTTGEEVTAYGGPTMLNNLNAQRATAWAIEYRRGISRYVDWSIGVLGEGDYRLRRGNGLMTELWAVRPFCEGRWTVGLGGGAFFPDGENKASPSTLGIVSMSASHPLSSRWLARVTWDRVITPNNSDTDILLLGLGYQLSPP